MRKIVPGSNDLATLRPDIAAQWHPTKNGDLTPDMVMQWSNKKVWWLCDKGHEWEVDIDHRSAGSSCPICAGQQVLAGYNDLATLNPSLTAQWHTTKNGDLTPDMVMQWSNKKVWWKCDKGHEWEAVIYSRSAGNGCRICSGQQIQIGINDLMTLNPSLAAQWHPTKNRELKPEDVMPCVKKKVWWLCDKGHEYEATLNDRTRRTRPRGCPFCVGKRVLADYNDLASQNHALAAQWHPTKNGDLTPKMVTKGSTKKVWWKCDNGHEWNATLNDRTRGRGCPICWSTTIVSKPEDEIFIILKTLLGDDIVVQRNIRGIIGRQELDLYIPDKKFAIEFNGCYFHSEARHGKDPYYHLRKWQACKDKGITLYQVWSDDWRDRKNIVIRELAHRIGVTNQLKKVMPDLPDYYSEKIGARKAIVIKLDYTRASQFLMENHIHGPSTGTHYLGLQDTLGRLRSVLVLFRSGKGGELRIDRYASAGVVSGGFTKLLSYAEREYKPERFVTFADRSISDGGLYERTGFVVDGIIKPDYSYLVNKQRVHKFNYRLARFRADPNLLWEEGLTERELALFNNIPRIWDSGKVRYVKDILQTVCDRIEKL